MSRDKVVPPERFLSRRFGSVRAAWLTLSRRSWLRRLDRLTAYLKIMRKRETEMNDLKLVAPRGEPIMIMTRSFNAPRTLLWKALSEPEHVIRWWGPHSHKNRVLQFDWKVGGKWKFETTTADGQVIIFHGEYRDIAGPETVTQTFAVEGMYDGQFSVDTVTLRELDGKTIYVGVSRLPDAESRDAMMASGMESGVVEGFERLDQMLEEFKVDV